MLTLTLEQVQFLAYYMEQAEIWRSDEDEAELFRTLETRGYGDPREELAKLDSLILAVLAAN